MENALRTILTNDSQLALLHDAVVNNGMMMPAGLGADGKIQTEHAQFRLTGRKIRELGSIPTL